MTSTYPPASCHTSLRLRHSVTLTSPRSKPWTLSVDRQLHEKQWSLEIRTGCLVDSGGDVFVAGRALVRDRGNRLRAFSETIGTGDSGAIWKLYYDETSRLRVAIFSWRNYMGQKADGIMQFSPGGHFLGCTSLPNDAGAISCGAPPEAADTLDPGVELATRHAAKTRGDAADSGSDSVTWATHLDPWQNSPSATPRIDRPPRRLPSMCCSCRACRSLACGLPLALAGERRYVCWTGAHR
jgi:hypothetical protein